MKPPVQVGDLIHLAEEDYCYGRGMLTLRVIAVLTPSQEGEWIDLHGIEIAWNGDRRGERRVSVRVAALKDARQRNTS